MPIPLFLNINLDSSAEGNALTERSAQGLWDFLSSYTRHHLNEEAVGINFKVEAKICVYSSLRNRWR